MNLEPIVSERLTGVVDEVVARQPVFDLHTHLYPPRFGSPVEVGGGRSPDPEGLSLYGIDELLTYHYVVAEAFRVFPPGVTHERFWALPKRARADLVWQHLFVDRSPLSEACRGVVTTLDAFGLDPRAPDLGPARAYFAAVDPEEHVDHVMRLANVSAITMTNDPFDDNERARWLTAPGVGDDPRYRGVVRLDPLLVAYPRAAKALAALGYGVHETVDATTVDEGKRFLREWLERTRGLYVAVSLPPEFRYPAPEGDASARAGQEMLERVILPVCAERKLPFAMMIGVRRGVNPALREGGDTGASSDVSSVASLCRAFPANKFLVTMLARENQHELCVVARKFANLMVFGCWWFLNNPTLVDEITRLRIDLLGTSFIPQHSDARVLDQLVYKWSHSRAVIARALEARYRDLAATGWRASRADVERDVRRYFHDNFTDFLAR